MGDSFKPATGMNICGTNSNISDTTSMEFQLVIDYKNQQSQLIMLKELFDRTLVHNFLYNLYISLTFEH